MRIFNWAAIARPGWFLPDGIHYTSAGSAARARAIADALARAFPRGRTRGRARRQLA
jgi:lysophospholipase L1-like esterase